MAHVVNTLVVRPIHVAIVKGLNRKLETVRTGRRSSTSSAYAAAIAKLLHRLSFLGEVKRFEDTASPESAMLIKALALSRSSNMYSKYIKAGYVAELGRRENRGNSRGA